MRLQTNKVVRVKSGTASRYWGRIGRIVGFVPARKEDGTFNGNYVLVKMTNRVNPLVLDEESITRR